MIEGDIVGDLNKAMDRGCGLRLLVVLSIAGPVIGLVYWFIWLTTQVEHDPAAIALVPFVCALMLIFGVRWRHNFQKDVARYREFAADKRAAESVPYPLPHISLATKRTGRIESFYQVIDIGVNVAENGTPDQIYRTEKLPLTTDSLQPFIELYTPSQVFAKVKFIVIDSESHPVLANEVLVEFTRGRQLVKSPLRVAREKAQITPAFWKLRVSIDGNAVAEHYFSWQLPPVDAS